MLENVSDEETREAVDKQIKALKTLLSEETIKILQLLGFNFKRAIGEPLTEILRNKIISSLTTQSELEIEIGRHQIEMQKRVLERDIEALKVSKNDKFIRNYEKIKFE